MSKKVALINPGRQRSFSANEPLNLGFIASFLEKNSIEVKIVDELAGQDVRKELERYCPDVVGITATTPVAPDAYRIADLSRQMGILTVIGGVHAMILPEEALRHADIVVKGEGELAMLDIVKKGISRGVISRPFIKNIDEIPMPARHLMDTEFYLKVRSRLSGTHLYFASPEMRIGAILTTRGCPYHCIFCHNSWRDTPIRFNSPERVISEIRHLIEKYNIQALFFFDDDLFASKTRLKRICQLMQENKFNIVWSCQARVDSIDLETLKTARGAGCRQVGFGFESGSQRILDILKNKTTTVEQNKRAIKLCQTAGIIPWGTVMIGNPTETIKDVRMTQQFIRESGIDSIGVHVTTPFPGTELWKWSEERGLIPESFDWSHFTTGELTIPACDTLSAKEIQRLYAETGDLVLANRPRRLKELLQKGWRHPGEAVIWLSGLARNPSRIKSFLKRIKL